MSYYKISDRGEMLLPIVEYILTSSADVTSLPTDGTAPAGSTAYIPSEKVLYMFDGSAWHNVTA